MANICTLSGSLRAGSYNRMLVSWIAARLREQGHEVNELDAREHQMPIFDEDLESSQGIPEPVETMHEAFRNADALVLVTPEYNGSLSAYMKNAIDWVTRPYGDHAALSAIAGKPVLLGSASMGGLGGIRALMHFQVVMGGLGMHVFPQFVSIAAVQNLFGLDSAVSNPDLLQRASASVEAFGGTLT
ncbi:MAG: NADPH-dependent FMN reductase [Planctomycetota bacterium]|jgi:NAD(P)H-dependent FMN reductase